jgi:hypothetical protein
MPKYDMLLITRGDWQKKRDAAKVPKGAAKVSIGDSIEKVHKSFGPATLGANIKDTEQLIKNLDAYTDATKAKYPNFQAEVKKVRLGAKGHLDTMKNIEEAKVAFYPRYALMLETYKTVKNGEKKPEKLAGAIEGVRGCVAALAMIDPKWMAKQQLVLQWHKHCGTVDTLSAQDKSGLEAMFNEIKP